MKKLFCYKKCNGIKRNIEHDELEDIKNYAKLLLLYMTAIDYFSILLKMILKDINKETERGKRMKSNRAYVWINIFIIIL